MGSGPTGPSGPSYPSGNTNYGGSSLTSQTNPFITTNPLSIYSIASGCTFSDTLPDKLDVGFNYLNNNIVLKKNNFINSVNYFRANSRKNTYNSSEVPWSNTLATYVANNNSFKFHVSSGSVTASGSGTVFLFNYSYIQIPTGLPTNARLIFTTYVRNNGSSAVTPQVKLLLYDNVQTQANGNILSEEWANQKVGSQTIRWSSTTKQTASSISAGAEVLLEFNDQISAYYANLSSVKNAWIAWGTNATQNCGLRFTVSVQFPSVL